MSVRLREKDGSGTKRGNETAGGFSQAAPLKEGIARATEKPQAEEAPSRPAGFGQEPRLPRSGKPAGWGQG
jgi:hypothetical protein